MRLAVLSDVHSNKPALDAVLDHVEDVDAFLCCGDFVGYYCWPNPVINRLRERDVIAVRGNHDHAIAADEPLQYPAQRFNRKELAAASRDFLAGLPRSRRETLDGTALRLVHGSPRQPLREYVYPDIVSAAFLERQDVDADILLMGHTHIPFTRTVADTLVVNPGSVGQPRDGNPDAAYATVDTGDQSATIHRVPYDIDAVAARVAAEGFPERLADRLYRGQ